MLEDQAQSLSAADSAAVSTVLDAIPAPDPDVVDSARLRLSAKYALTDEKHPVQLHTRPMDDVRVIGAVINAERPDALDVGAGLVVLCNLRVDLDRLEADLLDAAQQVDLGWDVIAAIVGIPAGEAQNRHRALRARRDSQ
jgi:hypothetical protein